MNYADKNIEQTGTNASSKLLFGFLCISCCSFGQSWLHCTDLVSPCLQDAHKLADILQAHKQELGGWKHVSAPSSTSASSAVQDADGLRRVVSDYTAARLVRVCRMQRVACEGCGLPKLR